MVAGLQVSIKVHIDAKGTVVRTEPISKGNSLEEYLSIHRGRCGAPVAFYPGPPGRPEYAERNNPAFPVRKGVTVPALTATRTSVERRFAPGKESPPVL